MNHHLVGRNEFAGNITDYAGYNTYDSCYRAHTTFGLTQATLITQGYHLPRAMTACEGLGIKNIGVIAKRKNRDFTVSYIAREFIATDKMVIQNLTKPKPTILNQKEYSKVVYLLASRKISQMEYRADGHQNHSFIG